MHNRGELTIIAIPGWGELNPLPFGRMDALEGVWQQQPGSLQSSSSAKFGIPRRAHSPSVWHPQFSLALLALAVD